VHEVHDLHVMPYVDAYNHDDNFVAISGDTGEVNMVLLNQP